jgi:hypothetical protein
MAADSEPIRLHFGNNLSPEASLTLLVLYDPILVGSVFVS